VSTSSGSSKSREDEEDDEEEEVDRERESIEGAEQFSSVLKPVSITMLLAVWVVSQLREVTQAQGSSGYSSVLAYKEKDSDSTPLRYPNYIFKK
jgi:hypothetical protein